MRLRIAKIVPRDFTNLIFVVFFGVLLCYANNALALGWKWELAPGKERLMINLNVPGEDKSIKRTASDEVTVEFDLIHDTFNLLGQAPPKGSLVQGASLENGVVKIKLSSPAFGFLVSRPGPRDIIIDFFPDAIGARWTPSGLIPASRAPKVELPVIAKPKPKVEEQAPAETQVPETPQAEAIDQVQAEPAKIEAVKPVQAEPAKIEAVKPVQAEPVKTEAVQAEPVKQLEQSASEINVLENEIFAPLTITSPSPASPEPSPASPEIAKPASPVSTDSRKVELVSSGIIASYNPNGPEAWPVEEALSTVPKQPEPVEEVKPEEVPEPEAETEAEPETVTAVEPPIEREIVYKDEEGNIIPPPPDIPALMAKQNQLIKNNKLGEAYPILEELKGYDLTPEEQEEVLYNYLHTLSGPASEAPNDYYEKVVQAANEAINFYPYSKRAPEAFYYLSSINMLVENLGEAVAYLNILLQRYPYYDRNPEAILALANQFYKNGDYAESVDYANLILSRYPDSAQVKKAAIISAKALYKQGHYERASTIVDFINLRFPKLHLEEPEYLSIAADIMFRDKNYQAATKEYWLQYNLDPKAENIQDLLLRIGESYYLDGNKDAAAQVSQEIIAKYPDTEAAAKSIMRLGENGIYDNNLNVEELFILFEQDNPRIANIYYQKLVQDFPESNLVPTAKVRSIVWELKNGNSYLAMQEAKKFIADYPAHPTSLTAEEAILRGFQNEYKTSLEEENFDRLLTLWEEFPSVQKNYYPLEPDFRLALARGMLNKGRESEAIDLLQEFLKNTDNFEYSLYAYNIVLAKMLREENWSGIMTLGEQVDAWALAQDTRDQLDYSLALAAQNLNLSQKALPKWELIASEPRFPTYQRAYANYFLAREAERAQDLQKAYTLNLETLNLFTQLENEFSDYADSQRIKESIAALMDITEVSGQFAESLEWIAKYEQFVPESSPDYAGLKFREARVHRKMGDLARWKLLLDGIVQREPESVFGKMAASELRTQEMARDISRFN